MLFQKGTKINDEKERGSRILMLLAGESFRDGGQHNRARGTENSFDPQRKASFSHMKMMDYVSSKYNVEFDVFVTSYKTKYEKNLLEWYKNRLVGSSFKENPAGLENIIREVLNNECLDGYDSILVSRIDLEYKEYLSGIFDPHWNKIMLTSVCWLFSGPHYQSAYMAGAPHWAPRISDTIQFIPKKFMDRAKKTFFMSHEAWANYKAHGFSQEDMGFMLDTYHDSDSAKDYNPLYKMASRRESAKWHSPNFKLNPDRSPRRCLNRISFPDWEQPLTESYEDENFKLAYKYETTLKKERFSLHIDGREAVVRRVDSEGGWDLNVVLFLEDKRTGLQKELLVGSSDRNESRVSLSQEKNFYEDERFELSVKKHPHKDSFLIKRKKNEVLVSRTDCSDAWGHPHVLIVKEKATGKEKEFVIGHSNCDHKTIPVDFECLECQTRLKESEETIGRLQEEIRLLKVRMRTGP